MIKKIIVGLIVVTLALAVLVTGLYVKWNPSAPEQQVFFNGNILTMKPGELHAEAILVERDKVVAVGSRELIFSQANEDALKYNLNGKTLMPGLVDAHSHFPGTGLTQVSADLNSPPIGNKLHLSEVLSELEKVAHRTNKGDWVLGIGYDETLINDKRFPTRQELDAISTEHPVFVQHISAHSGVANSAALKLMGRGENTPNTEGGEFGRDASGALNGLLVEGPALRVMQVCTDYPLKDKVKVIKASVADYLKMGVTTAQNGYTPLTLIPALRLGTLAGFIPQRLIVWPDGKAVDEILAGEVDPQKLDHATFKVGAIKLVLDGSIQQFTGYLSEPYHKKTHGKEVAYRGYLNYQQQEFQRVFNKLHQAGHQLAVHANGDGAIDTFIEIFKQAQQQHFRSDAKPIVVHTQMVRDDQLDAFAELGISATFFNSHVYYWGQRHEEIFIGPERAARISPLRAAIDKGVSTTLHLDAPVVPLDPWLASWNAVTRETYQGNKLGIEYAITPLEALHAITLEPARQMMIDDTRGSIEVGKFADLIVLQSDPLSSLQALKNPNVLETFIGGVSFYPQ